MATLTVSANDNSATVRLGDARVVVFDYRNAAYTPRYEGTYETLDSPANNEFILTTPTQVRYRFVNGTLVSIDRKSVV